MIQNTVLLLRPLSLRPQSSGPWSPDRYACSPPRGPRTPAPGPLLKGLETRFTDGFSVARLVLLQQPAANQQPDATLTNLDWRGARGGVVHGRMMLVRESCNWLLLCHKL